MQPDTRGSWRALLITTMLLSANACSEGIPTEPTITDWSRISEPSTFQGNARHDGYVPVTLDSRRLRIAWTNPLATAGRVTQVVTSRGIVMTTLVAGQLNKMVALRASDGAEIWSYELGPVRDLSGAAHGSGRVYAQSSGHQESFLWCWDVSSGALLYRVPFGNQWSLWDAPVVIDNEVYMGGGYYGGLYRFDGLSGAVRYHVALPFTDGWTPAVNSGLVYVPGATQSSTTNGVSVLNAFDGSISFTIPDDRLAPGYITPVLGGRNNIITRSGFSIYSIDLAGRRVSWERNGRFSDIPVVANGVVFARNGSAVEALKESDGTTLWTWVPPEPESADCHLNLACKGLMLVTQNILFVGLSRSTVALDVKSGAPLWNYPASGRLAISQGMLYISRGDGTLSAIHLR